MGVTVDDREAFALTLDSLSIAPLASECAAALAALVAVAGVV
ncbi:hypothetical protein [Nocardioides pacificus]